MKKLLTLLTCLLSWQVAMAQAPCFTDIRNKGNALMDAGKYREAIDKFFAAKYCDPKPTDAQLDELETLIRKTQDAWVAALEKAKKDAQKSMQTANEARKKAEDLAEKGRQLQQTLSAEDTENFLVETGKKYFAGGDYRNALTYFAVADFLGDDDFVPLLADNAQTGIRANQYFLEGELDNAKALYEGLLNFAIEAVYSNFPKEQLSRIEESRNVFQSAYFGQSPATVERLDFSNVLFDKQVVKLATLSSKIGEFRNLKTIILDNHRLAALPSSFGNLTNLTELFAGRNEFPAFPKPLFSCVKLTTLILNDNKISGALPPEIGRLKSLQTLNLGTNQINLLAHEIGNLTQLRELNLSYNKLEFLSDRITALANLETLDLSGNFLGILPPDIGKLTKLKRLYLGRTSAFFPKDLNQFNPNPAAPGMPLPPPQGPPDPSAMPSFPQPDFPVEQMPPRNELERSMVDQSSFFSSFSSSMFANPKGGDNRLTNLPASIGNLRQLEELNLNFNYLEKLPEDLKKLQNLKKLDLTGNPLSDEMVTQVKSWLPNCEVIFHRVVRRSVFSAN